MESRISVHTPYPAIIQNSKHGFLEMSQIPDKIIHILHIMFWCFMIFPGFSLGFPWVFHVFPLKKSPAFNLGTFPRSAAQEASSEPADLARRGDLRGALRVHRGLDRAVAAGRGSLLWTAGGRCRWGDDGILSVVWWENMEKWWPSSMSKDGKPPKDTWCLQYVLVIF